MKQNKEYANAHGLNLIQNKGPKKINVKFHCNELDQLSHSKKKNRK